MANLWADIKKNLGEFVSKAADKAGEFTREAADKAEEVTKLGKVKLDIFQVKRDIEKQFSELGGTVYQLILDKKTKDLEKDEKVKACIVEIGNLEQKMKEKEAEYKKIQQESAAKRQKPEENKEEAES
jgi:hypothetical protein